MVDILLCNKTFERNNYNSQNSWWLWLILEGNIAYFNNITYIKRFSMWIKAFPIFIFVKICLRCFLAIPVCPLPIFENNASDQWQKVLLLGSNSFELGLKLHCKDKSIHGLSFSVQAREPLDYCLFLV